MWEKRVRVERERAGVGRVWRGWVVRVCWVTIFRSYERVKKKNIFQLFSSFFFPFTLTQMSTRHKRCFSWVYLKNDLFWKRCTVWVQWIGNRPFHHRNLRKNIHHARLWVDRRFVRSTLLMIEFGLYVLVLYRIYIYIYVCNVFLWQWTEARVSNFFSDRHFSFRYVWIYTRARAYLQLSISIWQSCRSIGKYCRFIGHDAVIVKLQQTQNINFVSWTYTNFYSQYNSKSSHVYEKL